MKMKQEDDNGEDTDLENLELIKSNPCIGCPIWATWKFIVPKKEQRIPHPIDGIEECEVCPIRLD